MVKNWKGKRRNVGARWGKGTKGHTSLTQLSDYSWWSIGLSIPFLLALRQ